HLVSSSARPHDVHSFPTRRSSDLNPLNEVIQQRAGQEVQLGLLRDGRYVVVPITPRENPPEGQGSLGVQIGAQSRLATLSLPSRSEEHTSELQSRENLVCRLLLEN